MNWRTFFMVAALYDLVLGAAFFFAYEPIWELLELELPNNTAYIHLTAAFVFVQGVGYAIVAQNPAANRGIVQMGIAYKLAFAGLSFYYFAIGELLHPTFLVFGILDVLFLIGFWVFLSQTRDEPAA
ncbi:MAG: hypothetical protein ACXWWU_08380 [Candidatus Limnocylindria bacterium]